MFIHKDKSKAPCLGDSILKIEIHISPLISQLKSQFNFGQIFSRLKHWSRMQILIFWDDPISLLDS